MSETRKRVLVGGCLLICATIGVYALSEDERPPLSWVVLLCGIWSGSVWLWDDRVIAFRNSKRLRLGLKKAFGLLGKILLFPLGSGFIFFLYTSTLEHNQGKSTLPAALMLGGLALLAQGMVWLYIKGEK